MSFSYQNVLSSALYQEFERLCLDLGHADSSFLLRESSSFEISSKSALHELQNYYDEIKNKSLLSLVMLWAKLVASDKIFGRQYLEIMSDLINHILPIRNNGGTLVSLQAYLAESHAKIIDAIRCHSSWYLQKQEDCVALYLIFANWLSEVTIGFIQQAHDHDRIITSKRFFAFDKYIQLLSRLPERERAIAKLFYLGGARSLEDVLTLKIDNVNFEQSSISFEGRAVKYPNHVFENIKSLLGSRKRGFVFSNMQNTDHIHHTVPYRALKKAAQELGLPASFSYKHLIEDI